MLEVPGWPRAPVGELCPGCHTRLCHSPLLAAARRLANAAEHLTAPHRTAAATRLPAAGHRAGAGEGWGCRNTRCPLCVPAMYSVEITVEKDRVTGETKVLSSTTMLPQNHCLQGVKVYEDELKGTARPTRLPGIRSEGQGTRERPPEHPGGHQGEK